jgi:hypothetical protein
MFLSLLTNLFAFIGLFASVVITYLLFVVLREKEDDGLCASAVFARLECGLCRKTSDKKIGYPFAGDTDKKFLEKHRNCKPGTPVKEEKTVNTQLVTEGA